MPKTLLKRCPETGRITGLNLDSQPARLLLPLTGLLAVAWFLFRVVPKPSRAAYPCQRVAAGIGTGFLGYLASITLSYAGFHFLHKKAGRAIAVAFGVVLAVGTYSSVAISGPAETEIVQVLTPSEGPNQPMGEAKGIYPGRVVWEQDFGATSWDGETGFWWEDANVDEAKVETMFSNTLQSLTGAESDAQAWDLLFRHHNKLSGRGDRGYRPGEKVIVKLNCNADSGKPWDNRGYPTPAVVDTMVRQLIEVAGVPGNAILLSDPSRNVGDTLYNRVRSNSGADYQQVRYEGQTGKDAPQRVNPEPDMDAPVHFDMPGGERLVYYLPKSYTDATYMINYALMRPHRVYGITLAAKNHYGSVYDTELKSFKPSKLHAFAVWDYDTPNHLGDPHSHPNLLGHEHTGGKTILYFVDGLYTSYNQGQPVVRWRTLGNRWFSSLMMSQDPIALDSVGYDLIASEPNLTQGNPSFNGHADSYLHESANASRPPSQAIYDPENDGRGLASLGVHEHWNNAIARKYSRNLGKNSGIELLEIN